MNELKTTLEKLKNGEIEVEEALRVFKHLPYQDLGFAKLDHHRSIRRRAGEIVYGASKSHEQIFKIVKAHVKAGINVCVSRLEAEPSVLIQKEFRNFRYDSEARMGVVLSHEPEALPGKVLIVTGGTSDIPVAKEAGLCLEFFGAAPRYHFDCGVAGLHRLTSKSEDVIGADVIIAVAGMEGALASVVAGMSPAPVIAVPTSVGTGASFGGVSALLSMLNSCAGTVSVVNIDGGVPAASMAACILDVRDKIKKGSG